MCHPDDAPVTNTKTAVGTRILDRRFGQGRASTLVDGRPPRRVKREERMATRSLWLAPVRNLVWVAARFGHR
jgi:hypothetical protein